MIYKHIFTFLKFKGNKRDNGGDGERGWYSFFGLCLAIDYKTKLKRTLDSKFNSLSCGM